MKNTYIFLLCFFLLSGCDLSPTKDINQDVAKKINEFVSTKKHPIIVKHSYKSTAYGYFVKYTLISADSGILITDDYVDFSLPDTIN